MDYPRPQMRRAAWTNLDGAWQFAFDNDALIDAPEADELSGSIERQKVVPEHMRVKRLAGGKEAIADSHRQQKRGKQAADLPKTFAHRVHAVGIDSIAPFDCGKIIIGRLESCYSPITSN